MPADKFAAVENLAPLAALVRKYRELLLDRWRESTRKLPGARPLDPPTLLDHIPDLILELADALEANTGESITDAHKREMSRTHGLERLQNGFQITEVVAEYNVLRDCLQDLAEQAGLSLQGEAGHIVNRVLDEAIGEAVTTYATQRAIELQQRREEHLAFVTHDLRTPLNAIAVTVQVLEQTLANDLKAKPASVMLKTLNRNVRRLSTLVTKVMEDEANLQTGIPVNPERRELDLWPLVHGLVSDLAPLAAEKGATVLNQVPEDLVVYADASLLGRIFQNLMSNAIEYTPHGTVTISARPLQAGGVECVVGDDGAGIPAARIDKVFDRLETDPEKTGGVGLGLYIVKGFVEAHGGTIEVESHEGHGATFRFTLPPAPGHDGGN